MPAPESPVIATAPLPPGEDLPLAEASLSASRQTDVGELPGQSLILEVRSLGREIWQIFKKTPDLPGIIFAREGAYAGMISSTQFFKIMSRPFGREIFDGRPVSLMLKELPCEDLILDHRMGIQNAIEACLERRKEFIYEPFLVVNPEKNLIKVCTVQVLMHASAQAAILRNRQMEQILGTVTDGLLLVDRDFRIGSEYSKALEKMLGRKDIAGKLFSDLLRPILPAAPLSQAVEYLQVLFDRKLIDRLIKSINPIRETMVTIRDEADPARSSVKYFAIDFERIHNRGEINQILVRIQDITSRITFAREIEAREAAAENRMKLMLQMVAAEPGSLKTFLAACENGVGEGLRLIRTLPQQDRMEPVLEPVARTIHRLKGDAALLQLEVYRDLLHHFEDSMEKGRGSGSPAEVLGLLEPGLEELLRMVREAHSILEQFGKWNIEPPPAESPATRPGGPSPVLTEQISDMIAEMSSRLGKKASLHALFDESLLPPAYREVLKDTLVQLVRNSMAHGIESPAQREGSGKSPAGVLQIAFEKNPDCYEIIFQDDGAGLNWEKIRRRAEELNLPAHGEENLKKVLFAPGFSTADQVTEDCGRGVGLDLIHTRIAELGGHITVHSEAGSYCAFQITLPLPGGNIL